MAKRETVAERIPVVEAVADPAPILCRDCKFWRRRQAPPGSKANIGECDFTRSFLPSPQMTLDLSTCSQAVEA